MSADRKQPEPATPVPAKPDAKAEGAPAAPPAGAPPPPASPAVPAPDLRETVIETLQSCFDPEIPVNIYDLGLVYGIEIGDDKSVAIKMTLTSPSCPVAETLPPEVERKVKAIPGIGPVTVDLVWEPPWGKHLLSEAARLQLGLF